MHRVLTIPSGALVFLCLFLPGYRNCGKNVAMADAPLSACICLLGLPIAIAASFVVGGRAERVVAAIGAAASGLGGAIIAVGVAAASESYIGLRLATAALIGLWLGCLLWLCEATDAQGKLRRMNELAGGLAMAAWLVYLTIAATSTWTPPPESRTAPVPFVVH